MLSAAHAGVESDASCWFGTCIEPDTCANGKARGEGDEPVIATYEEYEATREYIDRLQQILLGLRRSHSGSQYEQMSKGFLKELAKAQREIAAYIALPEVPEQPTSS
jgi:hypothetical protein